jgi:hypothetical protein
MGILSRYFLIKLNSFPANLRRRLGDERRRLRAERLPPRAERRRLGDERRRLRAERRRLRAERRRLRAERRRLGDERRELRAERRTLRFLPPRIDFFSFSKFFLSFLLILARSSSFGACAFLSEAFCISWLSLFFWYCLRYLDGPGLRENGTDPFIFNFSIANFANVSSEGSDTDAKSAVNIRARFPGFLGAPLSRSLSGDGVSEKMFGVVRFEGVPKCLFRFFWVAICSPQAFTPILSTLSSTSSRCISAPLLYRSYLFFIFFIFCFISLQ